MAASESDSVAQLLDRAGAGDEEALDALLPLVYGVLRRLSRRERHRAGNPSTLSTTELVHEAYLKLAPGTEVSWRDRSHFYRVAARAMRQVLVDRARRRATRHRHTPGIPIAPGASVPSAHPPGGTPDDDLLALDRALQTLEEVSPRLHSVVELRFFGGLTEAEVAGTLGLSSRTVRRDWTKARLFLHRELHPDGDVP
jgi:RNA polymerase sigma factor (TIGR02999 family)